MSRTTLVPSEQIALCARWQFASVGDAPPTPVVVEPDRAAADPQALHDAFLDGHAQGHAAGRAETLAEAQARFDEYRATYEREAAAHFAALFAAAETRLDEAAQEIARGTLEIACSLARQVLRHELATNPNALEPVVREALGLLLADGKSARVRLSQPDFDMLAAPLRAEYAGQAVTLVADAAVRPGDCLIESAGSVVDGGIATRWSRAVASLGLALPWNDGDEHDGA